MSKPPLGSLAIQAPSLRPQIVKVSPSTCHDLSLFKDLMKEYRRLDDSIVMRLNRTNAQFRDRERTGETYRGNADDQTCAYMWQQLVENWKRRKEIVDYCVSVVGQPMGEPRDSVSQKTTTMSAEEVKRNQIRNEVMVETIVRQRSLDAFRSRCKYFQPPLSDVDGRKWWDSLQRHS